MNHIIYQMSWLLWSSINSIWMSWPFLINSAFTNLFFSSMVLVPNFWLTINFIRSLFWFSFPSLFKTLWTSSLWDSSSPFNDISKKSSTPSSSIYCSNLVLELMSYFSLISVSSSSKSQSSVRRLIPWSVCFFWDSQ